mmetsp:Transcript_34840/g.96144  ORF Transcript_34840/g.96144 Transcript_34840/m.96144 type:complete len:202 (+) Transcript_34840:566-1171(+)
MAAPRRVEAGVVAIAADRIEEADLDGKPMPPLDQAPELQREVYANTELPILAQDSEILLRVAARVVQRARLLGRRGRRRSGTCRSVCRGNVVLAGSIAPNLNDIVAAPAMPNGPRPLQVPEDALEVGVPTRGCNYLSRVSQHRRPAGHRLRARFRERNELAVFLGVLDGFVQAEELRSLAGFSWEGSLQQFGHLLGAAQLI